MEPISSAAINAATAAASTKVVDGLLSKLFVNFAKESFDRLSFDLKKGLPEYLNANFAKCSTIKTLLNRNDPVLLADCYVAPDFNLSREIFDQDALLQNIAEVKKSVIVTGLAGSGKSVFLKSSFTQAVEGGFTLYPIFFELRRLNQSEKTSNILIEEMYESVRQSCPSFTLSQMRHGLKKGAFYFLLDGFDELNPSLRDQISKEILELSANYSGNSIIVTSRPAEEFVSWEGFYIAELLPFDLQKAVLYIRKLGFDLEKKLDFIKDLESGLFEKNKEFLSNPLLCAMMLLTYDSFGEIPERRHIFYSKCFEVLAREHDVSKGRFKRKLHSTLTIEQIENVFMWFCALTYKKRRFSFSTDQMLESVKQALDSFGFQEEARAVVRDFCESISIMEQVGLGYEFAHRSFQEYFYAKFVVTDRNLRLEEKVGWLVDQFEGEGAVDMIADMDQTYFEDEFLFPEVLKLRNKLKDINPQTDPAGILAVFYSQATITYNEEDKANIQVRSLNQAIKGNRKYFLLHRSLLHARKKVNGEPDAQHTQNFQYTSAKFKEHGIVSIKYNRRNNLKLIDMGYVFWAEREKNAILLMYDYLVEAKSNRQIGLQGLMSNVRSQTLTVKSRRRR